ncbi:hypothetical protein K439DRAFT_1619939 [Ramaria rubella]|nr:hypothetical protein K439DRAFT_1619939 [Ramaria rubella]
MNQHQNIAHQNRKWWQGGHGCMGARVNAVMLIPDHQMLCCCICKCSTTKEGHFHVASPSSEATKEWRELRLEIMGCEAGSKGCYRFLGLTFKSQFSSVVLPPFEGNAMGKLLTQTGQIKVISRKPVVSTPGFKKESLSVATGLNPGYKGREESVQ